MVIEGDSYFTTPDTTLSCNPSCANLEGGSSYVHLDDYIEWKMFGHTDTWTLQLLLGKAGRPRGVPARAYLRVMRIRVNLEGAREIITRRGRAFLALAASPRDGAMGSHLS